MVSYSYHRLALSRIAKKRSKKGKIANLNELAELFRAPVSTWRVVGRVKLRMKADDE
jgi:hypothetical protein